MNDSKDGKSRGVKHKAHIRCSIRPNRHFFIYYNAPPAYTINVDVPKYKLCEVKTKYIQTRKWFKCGLIVALAKAAHLIV